MEFSILIVDDDLGFAYLLEKALRRSGVKQVDSVASGTHAVNYIAGHLTAAKRPNLLFIDLKMDGAMDGFDLLDWLQLPQYKEISAIVLSASNDPSDREKSLKLGAKAFYEKPHEVEKLDKVLEVILKEFSTLNVSPLIPEIKTPLQHSAGAA